MKTCPIHPLKLVAPLIILTTCILGSPAIVSISVKSQKSQILVNDKVQFTATAAYNDGSTGAIVSGDGKWD